MASFQFPERNCPFLCFNRKRSSFLYSIETIGRNEKRVFYVFFWKHHCKIRRCKPSSYFRERSPGYIFQHRFDLPKVWTFHLLMKLAWISFTVLSLIESSSAIWSSWSWWCNFSYSRETLKIKSPYQNWPRAQKLLLLRQPGHPRRTRGFPSHDCSWFGFIGNLTYLIVWLSYGQIQCRK